MKPTPDDEWRAAIEDASGNALRAWWRLKVAPRCRGIEIAVWLAVSAQVVDVLLHAYEVITR